MFKKPHLKLDCAQRSAGHRNRRAGQRGAAYDARGNLTAAGTASYGYDAFDQLTTANVNGVPASLTYDVNGLIASTGTTRWEWDGGRLVTEAQRATILRRYVHGAGTDEPVLWYEGSGTGSAMAASSDSP